MDDPTRPWLLEIEDPVAFVRDVRNWYAEQREKYGPDWKDSDPGAYNRDRGLGPPFIPDDWKSPDWK
jgi:hypothetical protein